MKAIYKTAGLAKEYNEYAINIYTGCPHKCFYCSVMKKVGPEFCTNIKVRDGLIESLSRQIESGAYKGEKIHLCFTCDPYPTGYDSTPTRTVIKMLKDGGYSVQILTKGDGRRDFDLLDSNDWYGVTIDGRSDELLSHLEEAHNRGIKTWISFEPVIEPDVIPDMIRRAAKIGVDRVKIGKLNYMTTPKLENFDWKTFGFEIESLCKSLNIDYHIKSSLKDEMNK